MATKAQLEAELAHYKKLNWYITTTIMLVWVVGLTLLITYNYKLQLLGEQRAEQHLNNSLGDWHTEVYPAPEPMFHWPSTPIIDALSKFAPITSATAAHHKPDADLPQVKFPFASPLKLWSIEQLATDRSHLACSATRNFAPGITLTFTAYKDGTRSLVLSGVGFRLKPDAPYADTVVSTDSGAYVQVVSKRIGDYETSVDLSSMELTQLSNSKKLRITINNLFAEFDLTGSANAAKYVAQCNTAGPVEVLRRRVEAAAPAVVLETTEN